MTGRRRGALATIALAVLALVAIAPATAQADGTDVRAPGASLTAAWWQTFAAGTSLDGCERRASGVVLLAGAVDNTPVTRSCTVRAGVPLLAPLINVECSTAEGQGTTREALADCAAHQFADFFVLHQLTVQPTTPYGPALVTNGFRVQSGLFRMDVAPGNPFSIPPGRTPSVSDGWWALLRLEPGDYRVSFGGAFRPDPGQPAVFTPSTTYLLHVTD